MSHHLSPEMQACIDACHRCHVSCLSMAYGHCLEVGGDQVAPDHMKLMRDCADICATALRFMASGSAHHTHICAECAAICESCAESCEQLDGMEACAAACRACAESCRAMALSN